MATLEEVVLHQFPFPVAIRYYQMQEAKTFESKANFAISVYEAGLRSLTLGLLGQYLQHDLSIVKSAPLNDDAWKLIERPGSLKDWTKVFFETLAVYGGQRSRFFMPELYDFYWDKHT
jgi:hypothetical protein